MRLDDPRHPLWLGIGIGLSVMALGAVIYGRLPQTAEGDHGAYIDPVGGPCHPERWALACRRWKAKGWGCETGPGGVPTMVLDDPDKRGGHGRVEGREVIGLSPDACGDSDPAPEHEVGHLLGLDDGGPSGTVMATPHTRSGMRIPERVP